MYYLVYISTAVRLMSDSELAAILTKSRENNLKRNVTGVLLYSEGIFMQVLEGEEDDVTLIYDAIIRDERHKNIIQLIDGLQEQCVFPEWSMGFVSLDPARMAELEAYVNPAKEKIIKEDSDNNTIIVLKSFIENNNLYPGH